MEFKYRGLRARLEHVDVTDEEVTRQLVRLQQQSQQQRLEQDGQEKIRPMGELVDGGGEGHGHRQAAGQQDSHQLPRADLLLIVHKLFIVLLSK